ncbi:MAG: thioredoxin domain-containing protein [Bacteroidota bacterium]|nr:thioredoxin domain-containing protein [Bacteroidota bacterium]
MKKIVSGIATVIIFINIQAQSAVELNDVIQTNAEEFRGIINDRPGILLDVRTKSEFEAEHIKNADQLNYYAFDFKRNLLLLPKDENIYLYCNTGYRSQKAGEFLVSRGYTNVINMQHGIMEWNLNEFKVVKGERSELLKKDKLSIKNFNKLTQSETLILFDFYAPWCAPCRQMMPMIDSLKTEYHGKILIVKVNADASKKLIKNLELIGVPYQALYQNGNLLHAKSGKATREEIVELFQYHLKPE